MANISPQGEQLLLGTAGPLVSSDGRRIPATFAAVGAAQHSTLIPQTDRWPLPGSGGLHPLDYITIMGVKLPLASMPEGGQELDISERKEPGSDWSSFVSHGKKSVPVRISLRLFRDQSLGYRNGAIAGKDWIAEYEKIASKLIAKNLSKRQAVPVYYPTLHTRGCDSLIFTRVSDPKWMSGQFYAVELEGRDPRTIRVGSSQKVAQLKDFGTRANPIPPQQAKQGPSAAKKGK